jgi:hypothetical protein
MLVGQRHDEPVEAVALQLAAQGGKAVGVAVHHNFPDQGGFAPS